jgi:hypothetical protein
MEQEEKNQNKEGEEKEGGQSDGGTDENTEVISLPVVILIGEYVVILDIIGYILLAVALPDFGILSILASPVLLYLNMKKIKMTMYLIGEGVGMIPYVGTILPMRSISWFATCCYANKWLFFKSKLVEKLADKAGRAVSAAKGDIKGAVGAGPKK